MSERETVLTIQRLHDLVLESLAAWQEAANCEDTPEQRRKNAGVRGGIRTTLRDLARLSAGADPVPVCQWREIATAPKDGTRILLTPAVWTAKKVVSAYYRLGLWWVESADVRGSMRAFTDPDDDASHWPFTHWMPLPAPPVALVPAEQTNKE